MISKVSARLKAGVALVATLSQLTAGPAAAFCGFYVAKADSKLFNKSSKVVLTRDGNQTAITMASDYEGDPNEFAVVIPVPTFIERRQIGVVDSKTIYHLDAYTAPRLVEYSDPDPCRPSPVLHMAAMRGAPPARASALAAPRKGVTVEASYDVAEYDVSILSAEESNGLVDWLTDNGYRIPNGAAAVLGSYIKQNMRFFVAKVNLERMKLAGNRYLRPLQVRYEMTKFMVPLRLGTVNANGPQDLIIYALTRKGRVEAANYRTSSCRLAWTYRFTSKRSSENSTRQCSIGRSCARTCMRCLSNMPGTWAGVTHVPASPCQTRSWSSLAPAGSRMIAPRRFAAPERPSSRRVCMCATMPNRFRKTSRSRRHMTARISRVATCCVTRGRATRTVRRPRPIAPNCQ
jgi:hypothetical protein